ncbi:hypothetical protein [Thermobaculum terrenum]|uniref:hypothetical protein n=1 Tax=Thermobaculum terrenum TaxID=166501 RepID=UPI00145E0CB6|nr:hypothetical protein [Thermobaculum terrenum]
MSLTRPVPSALIEYISLFFLILFLPGTGLSELNAIRPEGATITSSEAGIVGSGVGTKVGVGTGGVNVGSAVGTGKTDVGTAVAGTVALAAGSEGIVGVGPETLAID